MRIGGQRHGSGAMPWEWLGTHCIGGWGGGQGRSGRYWKSSPHTGIRKPYHPAGSESLYWLSYPCPPYGVLTRAKAVETWNCLTAFTAELMKAWIHSSHPLSIVIAWWLIKHINIITHVCELFSSEFHLNNIEKFSSCLRESTLPRWYNDSWLILFRDFLPHGVLALSGSQIKSNKMQQCLKILFHVYMKLNMFRATHLPSSGAQNCTSSLWFCIRGGLLAV